MKLGLCGMLSILSVLFFGTSCVTRPQTGPVVNKPNDLLQIEYHRSGLFDGTDTVRITKNGKYLHESFRPWYDGSPSKPMKTEGSLDPNFWRQLQQVVMGKKFLDLHDVYRSDIKDGIRLDVTVIAENFRKTVTCFNSFPKQISTIDEIVRSQILRPRQTERSNEARQK